MSPANRRRAVLHQGRKTGRDVPPSSRMTKSRNPAVSGVSVVSNRTQRQLCRITGLQNCSPRWRNDWRVSPSSRYRSSRYPIVSSNHSR